MDKIKVAVFDAKPYDIKSFTESANKSKIKYKFFETKLGEDTAAIARGYDAVCVFVNDSVTAEVISALSKIGVKLVALRCAGFNNVDLKAAHNTLKVVRVPSYSPNAVAEHAMALLLCGVRKVHKSYSRTRDYNFSLVGLTGFDLNGKTAGVVGTGKIGRIFADICKGFGMNVLAYDPYPIEGSSLNYVSLDELIAKSDIISLHCPLTDNNLHMIDERSISKMKRGVMIVNTSRGALVNTEDLIEGIRSGQVGGAFLDVYEEEEDVFFEDKSAYVLKDDTLLRLIAMPNVIVTSHQAFLTTEALSAIAETTTQNILDFFDNKPLKNEVCHKCDN